MAQLWDQLGTLVSCFLWQNGDLQALIWSETQVRLINNVIALKLYMEIVKNTVDTCLMLSSSNWKIRGGAEIEQFLRITIKRKD